MSKIDKKMLAIIIILAIVMGILPPVKVNAYWDDDNEKTIIKDENYNAPLENSKVKARIIDDKILQSNGNLWQLTQDREANKIDTKVSDCYFYQGSSGTGNFYLKSECKLYQDGNFKVKSEWISNQEIKKKNNEVFGNVKQILYNYKGYIKYIDKNNDIYEINCFDDKVQKKLIESGVSKAWSYFYTKDGCTYKLGSSGSNPERIFYGEIIDAYGSNWIVDTDKVLYNYSTYSNKMSKVNTDFKEFAYRDINTYGYPIFRTNSNELKVIGQDNYYDEKAQTWINGYVGQKIDTIKKVRDYELQPNNILIYDDYYSTIYHKLTNVVDIEFINDYYVAVRSDGTVWISDGGETPFVKVIETKHNYVKYTTEATLNRNGDIFTICQVCGDLKSEIIYYPKTIKLSKSSFVYNKKVQRPTITVKGSDGKVIPASNYSVSYSNKNSKKVGQYTVTIKFKGKYYGTKKLTYTIKPKEVSLKKLSKGSKQFKATWSKNKTETSGYQIQYSTNKNFKSGNKKVYIKNNKTTSTKIKNLKKNKKYYVKVRTYKNVNGKKIFSSWSNVKNIKTK